MFLSALTSDLVEMNVSSNLNCSSWRLRSELWLLVEVGYWEEVTLLWWVQCDGRRSAGVLCVDVGMKL